MSVLWLYVLDGLAMLSVYIDADDGFIEIRICGLQNGVVNVIKVIHRIETFEDEFEQGLQVLRTRRCNENIAVAMRDRGCHGHTQCCRLSTPSSRRECHCTSERLLRDRVDEREQRLGLIHRLCQGYQRAHRLCVK